MADLSTDVIGFILQYEFMKIFTKCPDDCSHQTAFFYLRTTIGHLNDEHGWSREEIADWLDTLDIDFTIS